MVLSTVINLLESTTSAPTTTTNNTITSNFLTSAEPNRILSTVSISTTYADDAIITHTNNNSIVTNTNRIEVPIEIPPLPPSTSIPPLPPSTSSSHHIYYNDQPQFHQNLSLVRPDDGHLLFNHSQNHLLSGGRTSVENLTTLDHQKFHYSSNATDSLLSLFPTELIATNTSTLTTGSEFNDTMNNITINDSSISNDYFNNITWPKGCAVTIFLLLILITVIGNTLVILSVLTTRRLRTVTNCFVMNLAITDWLVGIFVMPPAVIIYIVGE